MRRETEWRRVDNTGCVQVVLTLFLLGWAVMIPYALIYRNTGWLTWSVACVALGVLYARRQRKKQSTHSLPGVGVEVVPESVRAGETIAVRLMLSGEVAGRVRWWKAALRAKVVDEHDHESDEALSASEFVVDPSGEEDPVSELEMVLAVPRVNDAREWWVVVTVETERGRMESGRVGVSVER